MEDDGDIERVCVEGYTGSGARQVHAQKILADFDARADAVHHCRALLMSAQSPYAQFFAASTLVKCVSKQNCDLSPDQLLELREFTLNLLSTRSVDVAVSNVLSKLVARISKLQWLEPGTDGQYPVQDIVDQAVKFLSQGNSTFSCIGAQLLLDTVVEMDQPDNTRGLTKHRKIASSFRDNRLLIIFELCFENINRLTSTKPLDGSLLAIFMQLAETCLGFDFIGTYADESSDDFRTVQIPANWRELIVDPQTLQTLFAIYMNTQPPISQSALGCLVLMASIRRTLFNNDQRMSFLVNLTNGVLSILESARGLDDQENYHEFCRLLARLKTNFQLSELVKVESYGRCMEIIATFTVQSLSQWTWSPNSLHFLLSLWERLVASVPFAKVDHPHMLESLSARVVAAYIQSRLDSVKVCLQDPTMNPLDDVEALETELTQFSVIARYQYGETFGVLTQCFEPALQGFLSALSALDDSLDFRVAEGQIVWLIYMVGALLGTKNSSASDDEDLYDGNLMSRLLQLMSVLDTEYQQANLAGFHRSELIDAAFIYVFQQFRASYIGDSVHKSHKMFVQLADNVGLKDEDAILSIFVRKIIDSLEYWLKSSKIIEPCLKLFSDLCSGYTSVRKLVSIDTIQFVLQHHSDFRFLAATDDSRHRTSFYSGLGRILTLDASEDQGRFELFMQPFAAVMRDITSALHQHHQLDHLKPIVLGLARDLRGIAVTCANKISYTLLFEWIFPDYISVFTRSAELFADEPKIVVPILKFMCEFVSNRNTRLNFGVSSASGLLLFREASKMLVGYGSRTLEMSFAGSEASLYPLKYKGFAVCFNILKNVFSGDYVNFGVFQLYGDIALDAAFDIFFKMLVSIPMDDLLIYPKLTKAYYGLISHISRDHMRSLCFLDPALFQYVMSTLLEGLKSVDSTMCTQCCSAVDNVLTHAITGKSKAKIDESALSLEQLIRANIQLFNQMLRDLLTVIVYEECKHQWSLSRPLLGLIILSPDFFMEEQRRLISTQPPFRQEIFTEACNSLMEGVGESLSAKNRDHFTQNLAVFRRDVNNLTKSAAAMDPVATIRVEYMN
eukprot:m.336856 g.336856  ORF g.336856 m.336856 type:complete len:1074 (+) comp55707_c0_seq3:45-3266(+)